MSSVHEAHLVTDPDIYQLDLSPAEIYWLASALGYTHLPFGFPFGDHDQAGLTGELRRGQEALKSRQLIQHVQGRGWQVERLLVALVRATGGADWTLAATLEARTGERASAFFFPLQTNGLAVFISEKSYHFNLCPDLDSLAARAVSWLNLHFPDEVDHEYTLTLTQPVELIHAAWRADPRLAEVLGRQAPTGPGFSAAREWLESIAWIVQFRLLRAPWDQPAGSEILALTGNDRVVWRGLPAAGQDQVEWLPADRQALEDQLRSTFVQGTSP